MVVALVLFSFWADEKTVSVSLTYFITCTLDAAQVNGEHEQQDQGSFASQIFTAHFGNFSGCRSSAEDDQTRTS